MRLLRWLLLTVFALLAACTAGPSGADGSTARPTRTAVPTATADLPESEQASSYETRTDSQGAVVFEVTPLNLSASADTLEFEVVMNTHSVDLGWDLAGQASLSTDTGLDVQGVSWPVGNGHHYDGVLAFPATSPDGSRLLAGATTITLVVRDTDVPERRFAWDLAP